MTSNNPFIDFITQKEFHPMKSKQKFSQVSKDFIQKLLFQFNQGTQSFSSCETYNEQITTEIPKGKQYDYLLDKIKEDLQTMQSFTKKYSFFISSRKYSVHLVYPHHISSKTNPTRIFQLFDKYIQKIYVWLFIANQYASPSCSENLNIYIYMTNNKKKLPKRRLEPLSRIHCNSAYTMTCTPEGTENEIYIFRKEEWFKVLIHETFHSLGLDFSNMNQLTIESRVYGLFQNVCNTEGGCDLRVYETYCETWAEILNVVFVYGYREDYRYGYRTNVLKEIEKAIQTETIFSLFQCVKILSHYQLKYKDLYENEIQSSHQLYKENTNVFAYYVLKCICIFHYNDFIEWCNTHNSRHFVFKKTQKNLTDFFLFIQQKYNEHDFIKSMENMEKYFLQEKYHKENPTVMNNLRMSVIE